MITEPNRKGDIAEMKAVVWLLEKGYEVLRNVCCTGDTDLVVIKDGKITRVDVKTLQIKNGSMWFKANNHEEIRLKGIKILWVYNNTVGWNRDYF